MTIIRIFACIGFFLALPAHASMTCGTRSVPNPSDYAFCVSPDYTPPLSLIDGVSPTDDQYGRYQWNLRSILQGQTYLSILGDAPRDVKVAVIDRYPGHQNHPDLINVYLPGINVVEGGTNTDPPVWDGNSSGNSHGQCVASVIAAEHNFIGVAGVFHRARIIPVRASFNTLDVAIRQAALAGAEVIHIAGWDVDYARQDYVINPQVLLLETSPTRWMMKDPVTAQAEADRLVAIRQAIQDVTWTDNVIVSTVHANWDGRASTQFLPGMKETVATMAFNVLGEPSPFNSLNYSATILAPGGDRRAAGYTLPDIGPEVYGATFSDNPDDPMCAVGPFNYSWGSGGSFAGPHTAAALAIIKSYLPNATHDDAKRLLVRSGRPATLNLSPFSAIPRLDLQALKAAILLE